MIRNNSQYYFRTHLFKKKCVRKERQKEMRNRLYKNGLYRHFKGQLYQVIDVATHTENHEALVVYRAMYGDNQLYVRPIAMFLEAVPREKENETGQHFRFQLVIPGDEYDTDHLNLED